MPPIPARTTYADSATDETFLEDESGRIRLVGERLKSARLVTGVIMGALGLETSNGDFEIVDYCFAGMAPQETSWTNPRASDDMEVDAGQ